MKKLKGNLYAPNETVQNYNDGSFEQLPAGVYCCKICQVKDEPDKEYLYVEYDIAEGPFKGYFERLSKFVEKCVNECLDKLEDEYYESLDKSELIRLLREKK